jgi:ribosomal protein S18 acetylase RimI-like enzyme
MSKTLTLRPCLPADDAFQLAVYTSTRAAELARVTWPEAEKQQFVHSQFAIQRQAYRQQAPQAEWSIIEYEGQPVGRLIVEQRPHELGLMDVALLPDYRGRGLGTHVIQEVMERAARLGLPMRLYVEVDNARAQRLYERLGFRRLSETGMHLHLEWRATQAALQPNTA